MNNGRLLALFIITVFISACASTEKSCLTDCQSVDANSSELKVWWSPALRNGAAAYSTVSLND